jgi:hypothetical protein
MSVLVQCQTQAYIIVMASQRGREFERVVHPGRLTLGPGVWCLLAVTVHTYDRRALACKGRVRSAPAFVYGHNILKKVLLEK